LIFAERKPASSQRFASAAASSGGSMPIQPLNSTRSCTALAMQLILPGLLLEREGVDDVRGRWRRDGDGLSVVEELHLDRRLGLLGLAVEVEKEVINIIVANDQVDKIFERMYVTGNLDTPGMGFIYVTPLEKAGTFIPQDVAEKLIS